MGWQDLLLNQAAIFFLERATFYLSDCNTKIPNTNFLDLDANYYNLPELVFVESFVYSLQSQFSVFTETEN